MANVIKQRMAAEIEGDFVVFIIGARFGPPWKIFRNFWFINSMPKMLRELEKKPEAGLLGYRQFLGLRGATLIQYWRSFEQLEAYARSKDAEHFPNWVKFNKRIGSNGEVGIWHETYKVRAGEYEAVYNNMPPFGLGKVGKLVPAAGCRSTAKGRITGQDDEAPVSPEGEVVGAAN